MRKIKCECQEWELWLLDEILNDMDKLPIMSIKKIHECKTLLVYQKKTGRKYFFEIPPVKGEQ